MFPEAPHSEQLTGCTAEKYCLLHVVVQRPRSFRGWSTFLYDVRLRSNGVSKLPNFRILAYFPHTKPLKSKKRVTSQNDYDFSMWQLKVQRGAFRQCSFPATFGRGAGDSKLAQIFAYGKWLYPYRMLRHGASDLDQRCLKMCNSKDGCTFPPNIFAPTPKTPFWGTF